MPYNTFARSNSTHEDWKIVDKFDSTYWSGLDVQIYFNNILINEAIQISYVVNEQVRAYYGYSSYVPDRFHHGARVVQGEMTINFKRDGYIFSLLKLIADTDPNESWFGNESIAELPTDGRTPVEVDNFPFASMWAQAASSTLSAEKAKELINKGKKVVTEDAVFRTPTTINTRKGIFESQLEGFDINIVYGANLSSKRNLRWIGGDEYELAPDNAQYGDGRVLQVSKDDGLVTSTGLKLIGTSISGLAKTINDDGRPIVETYSFQAKDVVPIKVKSQISTAEIENNQGKVGNDTQTSKKR